MTDKLTYGGTITSLGGAFAAIGTAATGGFWGGVLAGAVGGSIAGGVNAALGGGDLGDIFKGALIGGIQGAASAGIGHGSWLSAGTLGPSGSAIAQTAAHGILGGAVNEAMGGKFQDGFLSAAAAKGATFMPGLGKFLDPNSGQGNILSRTALAATIGGTASALGGGKFANGAYTAAMQHLFNEELPKYKVILYVDAPKSEAIQNGVMNAAIDTGHTWLEFEGPDSKWTFSFGPKKPVSPGDLLLRDGVPSKNNYPFTSHVKTAVSMEWLISKVQFDNAKILAGKFNINYSKHITCTSTALSLLNRINVNPAPPTGLGPVIVRSFGITAYSNKSASNPYNLSKEISK